MAALAAAELICLAARVQAPETGLLSHTRGLPALVMTFLAFSLVAAWAATGVTKTGLSCLGDISPKVWRILPIQLGSYAAFLQLTLFVFGGGIASSPVPALWALAWLGAGLATAVFWLLAVMPARAWVRLAARCSSLLAPCAILMTLSLVSGSLASRAWAPLRGWTFLLSGWILKILGQDVISRPADLILGTKEFAVAIHPACAGHEGIGLMLLFVGSYLWFFRDRLRFPGAYLLLPLGALAIWLVNALRIAALVMFGTYVSPQVATEGFHSQIGWLGFIAVSLGLVVLTQRMALFSRTRPEADRGTGTRATAYLAPLMCLLASRVITGLFTSDFDLFYPVRTIATAAAIWYAWRCSRPLWATLLRDLSWRPFAIGAFAFAVWIGLDRAGSGAGGASISRGLAEMPGGLAAGWLFFRVAGSVVTTPIAEELAFRGYLIRRLSSADPDRPSLLRFSWLPFLLSSILFGAMHGRWLAGAASGMCYAWAMYGRGRTSDAIIAHAVTNALIAADVLVCGQWGLWA
jgi:exosortase E/protease (VPEID-CTERM system)